jgi:hypothetical protein
MKKDEIKIGQTYLAKVNNRLVPVRIDKEHAGGGWDAMNMTTNRPVRIKSAQRLRNALPRHDEPVKPDDAPPAKPAKAPKQEAKPKLTILPDSATVSTSPAASVLKPTKLKKVSGLDAAAQVLKNVDAPMRCKDIVQTMLDKGMWTTGGATPWATIYAAILREIQTKGSQSRFQKTDRGLFTLTSSGKKED